MCSRATRDGPTGPFSAKPKRCGPACVCSLSAAAGSSALALSFYVTIATGSRCPEPPAPRPSASTRTCRPTRISSPLLLLESLVFPVVCFEVFSPSTRSAFPRKSRSFHCDESSSPSSCAFPACAFVSNMRNLPNPSLERFVHFGQELSARDAF